jgi:hypothetical protein
VSINLIVFSKDRPMQLQALLDSIRLHARFVFSPVTVVYRASTQEYRSGYDKLRDRMPWAAIFQEQSDFRDDILAAFTGEYTCFAADDDIVFRGFDDKFLEVLTDKNTACFSLRLGLNVNYCYSNDKPNKLQSFTRNGDYLIWDWRNESLDFGYPLSVVSHVFRTDFIKELTQRVNFVNPNTFEGALQQLLSDVPPKMASYAGSRVVGVPANSVNASWTNRNGLKYGFTTQELNTMYLADKHIDITKIDPESITAAQQEIPYVIV